MLRVIALFSVLVFAAATIDTAKKPGELYWNNVLPNTPMPRAIQDLLIPEKTGTAVTVGKGGVVVNAPKGTNVNVGHGSVGVHTPKGTNVNVGHGGVGVHTGKGTNVNVGHGPVTIAPQHGKPGVGVVVNTPHKKKPVNVAVGHPLLSPYRWSSYRYAASDTQIQTDPNVALFFLEKDVRPGTKMTLRFTSTTSGSAFILRKEAGSMKKIGLPECDEPAMAGERKTCATSLESMVEFATSSLGTRNVLAVATTVSKEKSPKQQYKIESVKTLPVSNMVVCHAQTYAYVVFYCHTTKGTKVYEVAMSGNDGTKVKAVAVCHADTAGWNPKHITFRVLGVKPGSVPVCHFLPQDHIVWTNKK